MPVIHIPRRHYTQPQGRVELDSSHALSAGLILARPHAATLRDLASGVITSQPSRAEVVTRRGLALNLNGTTQYELHPDRSIASAIAESTWTTLFRTTSTAVQQLFGVIATGTNTALVLTLNQYNGEGSVKRMWALIRQQGGSQRNYSTSVNAEFGDGEIHAISLVYSASAQRYEFYLDGAEIPSVSTFGTAWPSVFALDYDFAIGALNARGTIGTEKVIGGMLLTLGHRRALQRDEIKELHSNPWQIFRAEPRRIYSLPSVGGGSHEVVPENSVTTPTSSTTAIQQTHLAALGSSTTTPICTSLSIAQTHLMGLASSSTTPTASAIAITTGEVHQVAPGNSICTPTCSALSIQQTHQMGLASGSVTPTSSPIEITQGSVHQAALVGSVTTPTCSAIGITQTHQLQLSSAVTEPASSPISINQTHLVTLVSSSITPICSPIGLRLPDGMVARRALAARVEAGVLAARIAPTGLAGHLHAAVLSAHAEAVALSARLP